MLTDGLTVVLRNISTKEAISRQNDRLMENEIKLSK